MLRNSSLGVLAIIAILTGWILLKESSSGFEFELAHGVSLNEPRAIADFSLIDHSGQPFTARNLEGQWSLLFIGFTHCPDICPMTLNLLGMVQDAVQKQGRTLQGIFVSVDPQRDTPDELRRYLGFFDSDFIGVSGSLGSLNRLCDNLDFGFVKVPHGDGAYTIDHSGALALIGPQAELKGYFLPPLDPEEIIADLSQVID